MKTDGGPAFPVQELDAQGFPCSSVQWGMSLRDWFASMATDGDVSDALDKENYRRYYTHGNDDHGAPLYPICTRQEARWLHADAMLAAREARDEQPTD